MQYFVEYWHASTGWNGTDFSGPVKLIPACGSDSVLPLDGRLSRASMIARARTHAVKLSGVKRYPAFRIMRGARFTEGTPCTTVLNVDPGAVNPPPDASHVTARR